MEIDRLKRYLTENTKIDADASYADFRSVASPDDARSPDRWLDWLREIDAITPEQFTSAHTSRGVETTSVEALAADGPHRYTKLGIVGRGGMAAIHVAKDEDLRRNVAYKVMAPNVAAKPTLVKRFLAEAQITAQLEHPSVVPVYAIQSEKDSGVLAYSMKLIDGQTLKAVLVESGERRRGGGKVPSEFRLKALLEHFLKCCDAVGYAHDKGVAHRDLKPSNIMIGPHGEVYVMDWGLAKLVGSAEDREGLELKMRGAGSAEQTQVGQVLGTPAYMAPEQAKAEREQVGACSDQYALGLILYEMVCGRRARPKLDGQQVLLFAREGRLPDVMPASARGRVRPEIRAIIQRATQVSPDDRYASVHELAADVRRFIANEEVMVRPDSPVQGFQRSLSNNRELTSLVLLGLLALSALLVAGGATKSYLDRLAADARQERLAGFVSTVGRTASQIDANFASVEARVEGLAAGAVQLEEQGQPIDRRWYQVGDFARAETAPPDLTWSKAYNDAMSTTEPDFYHPSGFAEEAARLHATRLIPLRHVLRRMHLVARSPDGLITDEAALEASWRDEKSPIFYAGVGFEDGMYVELPGFSWRSDGFDPRVRPWYELGKLRGSPRWGNPFEEAGGQGRLLMPCSMGLFDSKQQLRGVASVMTSFDFLIERYMAMPDVAGVHESFLLSDEGLIMLRSSDVSVRSKRDKALDASYATPMFHHPDVLDDIATHRSGYVESGDTLLGWQRLHVQGWSFVVEADSL